MSCTHKHKHSTHDSCTHHKGSVAVAAAAAAAITAPPGLSTARNAVTLMTTMRRAPAATSQPAVWMRRMHTPLHPFCACLHCHTRKQRCQANQHQSAVWMGRMRTPLLQFCACLHCHTCRQAQQQDQPRCSPQHRNLAASYHNASGRVPAGTPSLRVSRCAAANTTYSTKPLQDSRLHASSFPVQYLLPKQAARSASTCLSFPTIACNVHSSASRCSNPPLILLLHPRC